MRNPKLTTALVSALALGLLCVPGGAAQSTDVAPQQSARGVIRLRVRPKIDGKEKGLARKRFFLIAGSLEENRALVEAIERAPAVSRDCYYRRIGASASLIRWLKENDCESVYCRELEMADVEGPGAVPEFQAAWAQGRKEFGSTELALKWITVNLSAELRSGFYKKQQETLSALLKQAEELTRAKPVSVMTDRNGTAYFTDLAVGTYVISNLIPVEMGQASLLWNCEIKVKAGELGTERPFLISNQKGGNVKCVSIEKPLSSCDGAAQRAARPALDSPPVGR
ncbi:MAG TPA: hypothetical protein VF544_01635 [Pyrinomonadaceae bacterium]|jgi:hypothetical protein